MRLKLVKILEYYDVPHIFVAEDVCGAQYLCLLYDSEDAQELKYISVRVSKDRLNDFIKGHIDLVLMFTEPEIEKDYYNVSFVEDGIVANPYKMEINDLMLPKEGYFYDDNYSENQEMITRATKNNCPVIRLAFETPDNRHDIDTRCFTAAIAQFQSLIDNSYKKLYKNEDVQNSKLRLTTFFAASFDVEFITEEKLDIFGQSRIGRVLDVVNDLFSSEKDKVVNTLRQLKGYTANSYKKFIDVLFRNDMTINLKWVYSTMENSVHQNKVKKQYIKIFHDIINDNRELTKETHSFEGTFTAANKNNGKWTFKPYDGTSLSGDSEKDMLIGVVIANKNYKISCQSEQFVNETTMQSTIKYKLLKITKVE